MTPSQARIVDAVRSYVGCSLDDSTEDAKIRRAALAQLVARQVDDPAEAVRWRTNCGLFVLGIMFLLGVDHKLVRSKYVSGQAPAWILKIGCDLGVLNRFRGDLSVLAPGQVLYYVAGPGTDHFEFLLGDVDEHGVTLHGGGGRADNAITEKVGSILVSNTHPLVYYLDLPSLLDRQNAAA